MFLFLLVSQAFTAKLANRGTGFVRATKMINNEAHKLCARHALKTLSRSVAVTIQDGSAGH